MRFLFLFLMPALLFADGGLPLIAFTDDAVLNYFLNLWTRFLFVAFPIIAALSLFRS